jgi:acetyltransferase-like isoleucine patch superfamily enzyme
MHKSDRTFLNIKGTLLFDGDYAIGRGCRFDIGEGAVAKFGSGGYVNANTTFVISHGLDVGRGCAISWGCLFLDDDFHHLEYSGKKEKDERIIIGNNVWIGCNVTILKGVRIPDGCVIAANSVVTKSFFDENLLIAGNPVVAVKSDVSWAM